MLNKTSLKFIAGFIIIIAFSLASLYFLQTYFSPQRRAERRYAELQKQYAEDTYGGKTPEETLKLFVDALKTGDMELASKYFSPEVQVEAGGLLTSAKKTGDLNKITMQATNLKLSKKEIDSAIFISTDGNNTIIFQMAFGKNDRGIWKVLKF